MSPISRTRLGRLGESLAAAYLERSGWTILARNYRAGRKEIDLVASRAEVIAFVEVKTRAGEGFGHPLEAITWKKRREIQEVASDWIRRFGRQEFVYRFDAIAVLPGAAGSLEVEHVEDAWKI